MISCELNNQIMNRKEKIIKCNEWFKTLKIGDTITDIEHHRQNEITDLATNSVELYHTKVTDKGINCKQYYDIDRLAFLTHDFNK